MDWPIEFGKAIHSISGPPVLDTGVQVLICVSEGRYAQFMYIFSSSTILVGSPLPSLKMFCKKAFVFLTLVSYTLALSPAFLACQLQKPASISPTLGCPKGTIFVSATDRRAHFNSVQDAVISLCDTPPYIPLKLADGFRADRKRGKLTS